MDLKHKKAKHYKMEYRQRVFKCKHCHLHMEFFGNDPVVGKCHCCHRLLSSLPVEIDNWVEIDRKVTSLLDEPRELSDKK